MGAAHVQLLEMRDPVHDEIIVVVVGPGDHDDVVLGVPLRRRRRGADQGHRMQGTVRCGRERVRRAGEAPSGSLFRPPAVP